AVLVLARRGEKRDVGVLADVVTLAADEDERLARLVGEIGAEGTGEDDAAAAAVVGDEHRVRVAAVLAGRPQTPARLRDRARVCGLDRRREKLRALEEERPLPGAEDR